MGIMLTESDSKATFKGCRKQLLFNVQFRFRISKFGLEMCFIVSESGK